MYTPRAHRFPILPTHTTPLPCFFCKRILDAAQQPSAEGHPRGYGEFRKICPSCGCRTYYDLEPATVSAAAELETLNGDETV